MVDQVYLRPKEKEVNCAHPDAVKVRKKTRPYIRGDVFSKEDPTCKACGEKCK